MRTFYFINCFFIKKVVKVGLKQDVDICIRVWCETEWKIFEIYRSLLILVIPFSIMLITYTKICIELWKMPKTRRFLIESSNNAQESIGYLYLLNKLISCK